MYKNLTMALALVLALSFSGCGSKEVKINKSSITSSTTVIAQRDNSYTASRTINSTNLNLFQAVAEDTLQSGFKSFVFVFPILNSDINTTEKFIDRCASKSGVANMGLDLVTAGIYSSFVCSDSCGIFQGHADYGYSAADIKMSNEENGFNALNVINDLKVMGYYRKLDVKIGTLQE